MAVAAFIDHQVSMIREGQIHAFLAWLEANESRLAELMPAGSKWLGVYGEVIGGDSPGWWHTLLGLDNYGALDAVAEAVRDPNTELGRLINEMNDFFDPSNSSRNARWLYRAAPNIIVWE